MTQVFIADAVPSSRLALKLLLQTLNMQVVGEAADWQTTLTELPNAQADLLIVDWELLPSLSQSAFAELRVLAPKLVIVLISLLESREQAARAAGADLFINKSETPDRIVAHLQSAARKIPK